MRNDIKTFISLSIIALITLILNLPTFTTWLTNHSFLTTNQNDRLNKTILFEFYKTEDKIWDKIKGNNTKTIDNFVTQIPTDQEPVYEENITMNAKSPYSIPQITIIPKKITTPITILVVGDSMMIEGFGPQLEADLLTYPGITVIRQGKYSTGLNRIDYYDWYSTTQDLINAYSPQIIICMYGANDGQPIIDYRSNIKINLGDNRWKDVYTNRVNTYMSIVSKSVRRVYWVGQPIPATQEFHDKFLLMNDIYDTQSKLFKNVIYVNSWDRFAVNGQYSSVVADDNGLKQTVKYSDGVHLTPHGSKILSTLVINQIKEDVDIQK
jgi:uncharacterized protein